MTSLRALADLGPATPGVLPDWLLMQAATDGWIDAGAGGLAPGQVQPASVDLRLGGRALRVRCSFLPHDDPVEDKVKSYVFDELDLTGEGAVLERNRPYLIPLVESLALPPFVQGRANPKSSTGRLDVFTRVITDHSDRFDDVAAGYRGPLYLEVVPLSFAVRVRAGLALNQLRLMVGRQPLGDGELTARHGRDPLLFRGPRPAAEAELATGGGLLLSLDLKGDGQRRVGYRSRRHAGLLDMAAAGHRVEDF